MPALTDRQILEVVRRLIRDDAYAMTFQDMGQYRTALLTHMMHLDGQRDTRADRAMSQALNEGDGSYKP